jgi:hypothetical protein
LGRPLSSLNLIACHLGAGASMACIERGRCVDTTMGLTPMEGLPMAKRAGDVDLGGYIVSPLLICLAPFLAYVIQHRTSFMEIIRNTCRVLRIDLHTMRVSVRHIMRWNRMFYVFTSLKSDCLCVLLLYLLLCFSVSKSKRYINNVNLNRLNKQWATISCGGRMRCL